MTRAGLKQKVRRVGAKLKEKEAQQSQEPGNRKR